MTAADLTDWSPRDLPDVASREGRHARLERLDPARHGPDLAPLVLPHRQMWTFLSAPPPPDEAAYRAILDGLCARRPSAFAYAVVERASGRAMGHLLLMEVRPEHGVFEVGYIAFAPALQRTAIATEAIMLAADIGFDLGYRRLEWKCDDRNEPSKAAALRYGFRAEGLFRQHMVIKGRNRDTAWYAITDGEWPSRRAAFEAWLDPANFDAEGRQKRRLAEIGGWG